MEWISTKDKLPSTHDTVIIYFGNIPGGHTTMGYVEDKYFEKVKWRFANGNIPSSTVTHWMPLPSPPKS